ncbi:hypothetical protein H7J87_36110 [Mycolicibacterium wolinskyi]|uniref:Holliday junction resolvase RuvC n=1 Tax=Mycolicibacterium wolinskyi TaxID=59750 RepID=A0A1X2FFH2_9MYCO|nr:MULTISPECIES: hypothetical protein [Mycolicibacterium]MCV7290764.1 hypothetical protein [Mycolicibacterium wolinskyi]MCV7291183.1 hypothetical protein [Mycolicibacterium goodii]ORX17192.1 hypothetical protein AWC31_17845 [Mycolicibacterium wolinskyi]
MRLMGIAVKLETEGRPTARAIVIEPGTPNPLIVDSFALTGDDVDFTRQLFELSQATRSRSAALKPERVVIARADFPPTGSRKEGPKLRLLAEGAIAAAAREIVTETALATGLEIGQWDGTSKDEVKAKAKVMLRAAGLPQKWLEATMAAIGALAYSP